MQYEILYSCISHIGNVRSINQDNFICNNRYAENEISQTPFPITGSQTVKNNILFGVFDGLGGEECGETASLIAAKEAAGLPKNKNSVLLLSEYCHTANRKICDYAREHFISAMGTTAAMLLFSKQEITLCNIGDSKVFRLSGNELKQISKDHIDISAFGKKPPLSQNLGIPPDILIIEPYFSQGSYKHGDKYLICSDGLTDMLTCEEIKKTMLNSSAENAASNLVESTLKKGGKDNTTVILIEINQIKNRLLKAFNRRNKT